MSKQLARGPETKQPLARLRPDLIISQQTQENRTFFVLKDPISLQYMRLAQHERFIVSLLDGKRTLDDVAKLLLERFPEAEFDPERAPEEILRFLHQLSEKNFLLLPPAAAVETVLERKRDKWKQLLQKIRRNIFFFRIPVFDPDRALIKLHPLLRFIWTRWFMAFSVLLFLAAVVAVALHFDRLVKPATDWFTWYNLFLLWVAFIGVKVIHEFGHGLTAKNYGGEVHEMGILVIAFTPALYCDTTDAWMMPKRAHKILVSSAGIYVELIIASIAAFIWLLTQEGLVNQLAMIVMFLCSFSTVVFNANPLLKYDGYYMLSDAIEVPNLQQKSYAYVMMLMRRFLFGERPETAQFSQVPLPQKHRGFFATYSVASYFYRWFILYAISLFISQLLKPVGLEAFGKFLAVMMIFSSLVFPIAMSAYYFFRARQTKPDPEPLTRPITVLVVLAILFTTATYLPIPQNITRSCVLRPREGFVRAVTPGFVREVRVRDGEPVRQGQELAILENRDLANLEAQLTHELEATEIRLNTARATSDPFRLRQNQTIKTQIEVTLAKIRADLAKLVLRAPMDGTVQSFRVEDLQGRWVEAGQTVCQVSPTQPLRVIIPLDQRESRLVETNREVTLRVYGHANAKFKGRVSQPPMALQREMKRPELAANRKGDVPTTADPKGVERPSEPLYETEIEIDNPQGYLRPGMTGRAKIHCGRTTVAAVIAEGFRRLIIFDLQL